MAMSIGNNNVSTIAEYEKLTAAYPDAKRALCFGDSWFQYPPSAIDLNKQLAKAFKKTCFLNEGVAGRDSAQWKLALGRIQREIGTYHFDAILLSNGGNDVVGEELIEYIKTASQPQSAGSTSWGQIPTEVYDHVRLDRFEVALQYAIADIKEVVQDRDMTSPESIIYLHTYDYIYPDGKPYKLGPITVGPWAKPALDAVDLVVPKKQRVVTSWLLDQFATHLRSYASGKPNLNIIDSRGTLTSKAQWANEIHPTRAGFSKIAKECWIPQLTGVLK
jgi:hypothetical protein